MEIRFTKHSLTRCREQGISTKWVKRQLKKMPPFTDKIRWRLEDGHEVVVKQEGSNILLITIIGIKKSLKSKQMRDGRALRKGHSHKDSGGTRKNIVGKK